jgi:hypothetical protein
MALHYYMITTKGMIDSPLAQVYKHHMLLAQTMSDSVMSLAGKGLCCDPNKIVILDNGAHENALVDDGVYMDIIDYLRPQVVVLPDLIGELGGKSFERSMAFERRVRHYQTRTEWRCKFMIPVQGNSRTDVLITYDSVMHALQKAPGDYILGFGQSYLQFLQSPEEQHTEVRRYELIREVMMNPLAKRFRFHVLGGRWWPGDYSHWLNIIGLDSIKPLTCALSGTIYPACPGEARKLDLLDTRRVDSRLFTQNVGAFAKAYGLTLE